MATSKPVKAKAKVAPKKAAKPVKAGTPGSKGPGEYREAANPPNQPAPPAPTPEELALEAENQQVILAAEKLTALPVTEVGAEFAPGISMMPALKVSAALAPYKKQIAKLVASANRAVIDSPQQYEKGLMFMKTAKETADQLETYRKSVKGPIDDYGKFIQSLFLPLITALRLDTNKSGAYHIVGNKMLAFQQEENRKALAKQEEERQKNLKAAADLAAEEAKKGNAEVAQAIVDAAAAAPPPPVQTSVSTVSVGGFKASTRKVWKGQVESAFDVLRAILDGKVSLSVLEWKPAELNRYAAEKKVAGVSNGIKCWEDESLATRG